MSDNVEPQLTPKAAPRREILAPFPVPSRLLSFSLPVPPWACGDIFACRIILSDSFCVWFGVTQSEPQGSECALFLQQLFQASAQPAASSGLFAGSCAHRTTN